MLRRPAIPGPLAQQLKDFGALTSAALADGRWFAVSAGEFGIVGEEGVESRTPWTDIESASWDGATRLLTMLRVDGGPDVVLLLASDDVFRTMTAVRERISASIVHVEFLETAGGEVRALVRRSADGTLFSQLVARGPVTDADLVAASSLERRARAAAGLPTT